MNFATEALLPILRSSTRSTFTARSIFQLASKSSIFRSSVSASSLFSTAAPSAPKRAPTAKTSIYVFGDNPRGNLGLGDDKARDVPTRIPRAFDHQNVRQVACGAEHMLALTEEGKVYSWGRNSEGQLGLGDQDDALDPIPVPKFCEEKVIAIAAGEFHSCAITESGKLYTWGYGYTFAFGWGGLGHGDKKSEELRPRLVETLSSFKVVSVSCGKYHTAAVTSDGKLWTFGSGEFGRLGNGNSHQPKPEVVSQLANKNVTSVSCGKEYTMCLTEEGQLFVFGRNDGHQLGVISNGGYFGGAQFDGEDYPVQVESLKEIKLRCVAAGEMLSAATAEDGGAYLWGNRRYYTPKKVEQLAQENVVDAACGHRHILFRTASGRVFGFGRNAYGQLGSGLTSDKKDQKDMVHASLFDKHPALQVACAREYSAVVVSNEVQRHVPEQSATTDTASETLQ